MPPMTLTPALAIDPVAESIHSTTADGKAETRTVPTSNEDHLTFLLAELQGLENDLDDDDDLELGDNAAGTEDVKHGHPVQPESHQSANASSAAQNHPVTDNIDKKAQIEQDESASTPHSQSIPKRTDETVNPAPTQTHETLDLEKSNATIHKPEPSKNLTEHNATPAKQEEPEHVKPTPVEADEVKPLPHITPHPPTTPKPGMSVGGRVQTLMLNSSCRAPKR